MAFAAALNLHLEDLSATLPMEVVSTGLRYLIVPLDRGLERARIVTPDFEALLASLSDTTRMGAEYQISPQLVVRESTARARD